MNYSTWSAFKKAQKRGEFDDYEGEQVSSLSVVDKDEETKRRYREYVQQAMLAEQQDEIVRQQIQASQAAAANAPKYTSPYANPYEEPSYKAPVNVKAGIAADLGAPEGYLSPTNPIDSADFNKWVEDKTKAQATTNKVKQNNPVKQTEKPAEPTAMSPKDKELLGGIGASINNAKQGVEQEAQDFAKMSTMDKYNMYMDELEEKALKNGTLSQNQRTELSEYKYRHLNDNERKAVDMVMNAAGEEFDRYTSGGDYVDPTGRGAYSQQKYKEATAKADANKAAREKARTDAIAILKKEGWDDAKIERELARFSELADYRKTLEKNQRYAINPNDSAGEKFRKSVLNTAEAIPSVLYRGVESLFAEKGAYGRNVSSKYAYSANAQQEAVGQVTQNAIGEDHPYWQQIYQAGESGAEALVTMLTTNAIASGFGLAGAGTALSNAKKAGDTVTSGMKLAAAGEKAMEMASLVPFSANAYDSGYKDAVNRGYGESQAQAYGISVGAIEAATEIFSLDRAWKLAEGTKVGRNMFAAAAVQAGIEGSEEVVSELGSRLADYMCVDIGKTGKTQKEIDIEDFMARGMSREEASRAAAEKFASEVLWAGIGGAVATGFTTPIELSVGAFRSKYGKNLTGAISERYQNLEVQGDSEYENKLREDKAKYENNPTQYIVDNFKVQNEEDARIKQGLQEISNKEKNGEKLSVSDKSFIANHAQVDQEFINNLYDIGEDSVVPYKYREVKTDINEDQARKMLAEAAKTGNAEEFAKAQLKVMNSSDEYVSKHADEIISDLAPMAQGHGITQADIGRAIVSEKKAYLEGLKGNKLEDASDKAKLANNEGLQKRLETKSKVEVSSQEALKSVVVNDSNGNSVHLMGSFDSDGKIKTSDGKSVSVDSLNLNYDSMAAAKAYNYADNFKNVNTKNAFLNGIKENTVIKEYAQDWQKDYDLAMTGASDEKIMQGYSRLDDAQRRSAIEAGRRDARIKATNEIGKAWGVVHKAEGLFYNDANVGDKKFNMMFDAMAARTGLNVRVSNDTDGSRGSFDPKTNTITVNASKAMAVFHELSEFAEFYNKEEYDELKKAVTDLSIEKFGADEFHRMLRDYKASYGNFSRTLEEQGKNGLDTEADEMSGEMFNDVIQAMFSTEKGAEALANYLAGNYDANKAKTLGDKVAGIVKKMANAIRKLAEPGNGKVSGEYQEAVYKIADELAEHADEFIRVLDKAVNKYQKLSGADAINASTEQVGIHFDEENEVAFPTAFSLETWNESEYVKNKKEAAKALHEALGVSIKKAEAYIDQINSVAAMIMQDPKGLDYISLDGVDKKGNKIGMMMDNSEYVKTIDGSTLCKKRLEYTDTLSAIQRALPNTALTPDEMLDIVRRMQDKGYQTPCGLCYVESTRKQLPRYAKQWIEEYSKTHKGEYVPNMAEINTPEGIAEIRAKHPEVYRSFEDFMNKKGNAKPKLFQTRSAYQPGEILDFFKKGKKIDTNKVEKWNKNGGLRLQSYSDFEVVQMIDMMQVVMDMSRLGLWSQAYSKVPAFPDIFGGTGVKINCSTIAKGVDAKGNLLFDDVEGMPHKEAMRLRKKYSDNVGIVTVVFDDAQLRAALNNDQVDFVLPFHRSSWSMAEASAITGQKNIKDFSPWQNERYPDRSAIKNYMPNTYWDFSKSGRENAEEYLRLCNEDGRIPKFEFLLEEKNGKWTLPKGSIGDNYFKLLIDFKMYNNEGVGKAQRAVQPIFDMDVARQTLEEYSGDHSKDHQHKDIVDEFVKQYKKDHKGVKYSLDVDSEGNQLTEQQADYFKDSEIRDSKGNLKVMYHGTPNDFTVFDPKKLGGKNGTAEGYGIYFTENPEISQAYGGKQLKGYLNVTNPARYNGKTIKAKDLVKLIKATAEAEAQNLLDEGYDSIDDAIKDTWISNMENTYDMPIDQVYRQVAQKILSMNHNDMEIIQEIMADQAIRSYGDAYKFYDILKDTMGIDGFITEWEDSKTGEKNEVVVAIDSNQFKNMDNQSPTKDDDIRYSIEVDSEGNNLSDNQKEYFKDSKVVDDEGNLLLLYHGTNESFNEFKTNEWAKEVSGLSQVKGYFTTDRNYAENYGENIETYYINGKNPLDFRDYKGDGSLESYKRWLKRMGVKGVKFDSGLADDKLLGGTFTNKKGEGYTAYVPYEFIDAISEYWKGDGNITQVIADAGYDSLIWEEADAVAVMPFNANAIKRTDNLNPTESSDVRFSIDVEADGNGATFNGKRFWSGSVSLIDGFIEEVHSYKEAENADFHHSLYFSAEQADKIDEGENGFFWIDNGEVQGEWRDEVPAHIIRKIREQIIFDNDKKYSIQVDSEGRMLTEGQQRYFNDTKVVDDNGALKVMYHGTKDGGFTVFDPEWSDDRISLFFSDNRAVSGTYADDTDARRIKVGENYPETEIKKSTDAEKFLESIGYKVSSRQDATSGIKLWKFEFPDGGESAEVTTDYFIRYAEGVRSNKRGVYEIYLNIENPLVIDAQGNYWNRLTGNRIGDLSFNGDWEVVDLSTIKMENGKVQVASDYVMPGIMTYEELADKYGEDFANIVKNGPDRADFRNVLFNNVNKTMIPNDTRTAAIMAKNSGHDGVIIKNVKDYAGAWYVPKEAKKPSTIAIAFSPDQVKDIDNLNPTSSEDIRYELDIDNEGGWVDLDSAFSRDETEEKAIDILEKGMEALKNKEVDVPKLRTLAIKLRNEYGSSYNTNTLTENLRKAFAYMQTEDHVDYPTMMGILKDIARPVVEMSGELVGEEEYKDFINHFKGMKIRLTETQKQEVKNRYGTYGAYRNAVMPIMIADSGTSTLDQIWEEMVEQSGYVLDRDATEGDMPLNLLESLQAMRPQVRNDFGGDNEDIAKDLAMRIVSEYIEGEASRQMEKEASEYKARLKKDYQERLSELRGKVNAEVRARNKRRFEQAKERDNVRRLKHDIKINANKLITWVMKPTEGKSVPHNLMMPVVQFLQAIDFVDPIITVDDNGKYHTKVFERVDWEGTNKKFVYKDITGDSYEEVLQKFNEAVGRGIGSKAQRSWTEKMQGIKEIYDKVRHDEDFEDTSMDFLMQGLDAQGLSEEFDDLLSRHRGQVSMNHLSSSDLSIIDKIIKNIFHAVNQGNKAYSSANVDIVNLAQSTIQDSEGKTLPDRTRLMNSLHRFFRIDNLTPRSFFELLGRRGHEIYKFMRDGLNQQILDIKKASEFMEGVMKDYDQKEVKKWTGKKATIHEFNVSGGTIRMTDAHIMGLYKTIQREGAMDRIKGGIKIDKLDINGKQVEQEAIHLTEQDINNIISVLTPEQRALADQMQKYMADDCSKQGNETSMKLYGYKKFTEPNYYPYTVDKDTVNSNNAGENVALANGLERSGFTKQLKEGAKNPLIIRDIFDVFTDHVADMAAYHGFAAASKDTMRWMNYREQSKDNGFVKWITNKNAINKLAGSTQGTKYVFNLLLDINKANKANYIGNITDMAVGHYKAAAVGANLRVVVQQPTAYLRALNMVDPKYLLAVNPKKAVQNIKKSQDECPISWWKSKGYYETNLGQPIKEIVTGIASPMEAMKDKMMAPAGWADDFTWGFLYTAIEKEQRDLHKGENLSEAEFRKAVNDRFDEVVDNTQVVDSTLHRSQLMRAQDMLNKIQTAFMAEPTKSYNMLVEAALKDANEGKTMKRTARATVAFLLSALATSAASAVVDALRKAKDDEDWWEVWLENFKENVADNVNPFNLIPVVKDISAGLYNFATETSTFGQSGNRFDIEAISSVINAAQAWTKLFQGESNKTGYGIALATIKPISQITGIPVYNLTKDSVALYNAFFENIETSLNSESASKNKKKKGFLESAESDSVEAIDKRIMDAINNGVPIAELADTIETEYKSKYFEAYMEGDTDTMKDIEWHAGIAYARIGVSDEEIDNTINEWKQEVITYGDLDKAIARGEGIEEEIKRVREAKDDDKIIKHIMDKFASTVAYEDMHDTESDWRGNVDRALKAIDPTLDFDTAHEEAIQKKNELVAQTEAQMKAKKMKDAFLDTIESKDGAGARKALEEMKAADIEAKTIKSAVSDKYHKAWKDAKTQEEKNKAREDWKSAYKLINNVYGSKSNDLDQTWKKWEEDQSK